MDQDELTKVVTLDKVIMTSGEVIMTLDEVIITNSTEEIFVKEITIMPINTSDMNLTRVKGKEKVHCNLQGVSKGDRLKRM